ncbi:MAG: 4Fe-4S binding protein [Chloroflexota bacterium]|jgi:ferredoxin
MSANPYVRLARRLDALPNGFPPTEDGAELQLLAKLFTAQEAALAAELRLTKETPKKIAERIGEDPKIIGRHLKAMVRKGLISWDRTEDGIVYGMMPFIVGIYEMQGGRIDQELAELFEAYYQQAFGQALSVHPQFHRVIPVGESVAGGLEIRPFESAATIISDARAWGVTDCICRKQKALIGEPCDHPIELCMVFGDRPGQFDDNQSVRALDQQEALDLLQVAAAAGLVHSVSNNQRGLWYICNCCTCSCGILRGMAEQGITNVIARSAFVNQVDPSLCLACGDCLAYCQFDALSLDEYAVVDRLRCVGCGVCVLTCPEEALYLVLRPEEETLLPPANEAEWMAHRAAARGIDLTQVL